MKLIYKPNLCQKVKMVELFGSTKLSIYEIFFSISNVKLLERRYDILIHLQISSFTKNS